MTTFFDTVKRSFADVPTERGIATTDADVLTESSIATTDAHVPTKPGIATTEFLEASESLTTLFDLLGSTAFGPVKSDMIGNIKKLRDRQTEAPEKSTTLQDLVLAERAEKKKTATEGLLWLTRGLDFTAKALRINLENPSEELTTSFTTSYGKTLKQYHSFIVKGIFNLALKATPYRADFYKKLGDDQTKVHSELQTWLSALEKDVAIIQKFYADTPATKI